MEKNERFALTLLLLARTEEEKELVDHILDALPHPADKPEKTGGLLTGVPVLEGFLPRKEAFFQKMENILRLASFYVSHDLFTWDKWHWLFSSLCERHRWEMALQIATLDRHKREQSALRRLGSDTTNQRYEEARDRCIKEAKAIWASCPEKRIGEVCWAIRKTLEREVDPCPTEETIKDYLNAAAKKGELSKPAKASLGGRPRKN